MGSNCCKNALHQTKPSVPPPDLPPPDPGAPWPGDTFHRAPAVSAPVEPDGALPSTEFSSSAHWTSSSVSGPMGRLSPLSTFESCLGEDDATNDDPTSAFPVPRPVAEDAAPAASPRPWADEERQKTGKKSLSRLRAAFPEETRRFPLPFPRRKRRDSETDQRGENRESTENRENRDGVESSRKEAGREERAKRVSQLDFEDQHLMSYPPPGFPSSSTVVVDKAPESERADGGEGGDKKSGGARSGNLLSRFRQSLRRGNRGVTLGGSKRQGRDDRKANQGEKTVRKRASSSRSTQVGEEDGDRGKSKRIEEEQTDRRSTGDPRHPVGGLASPDSEGTTTIGSPLSNREDDLERR
uniref:Uncharacterized protein n=1 Tax=Toxoplasma gondii COUG TaxID=1074873 RepID=A0A2G8Y3V0_TOXGO|nr:hypothetical protein TGCOUG_265270 [Toxoplasma gondii COUG]